jgi:hypothetical protein
MNLESILLTQLSQFGLNPQDWLLEKITKHSYYIKSRSDQMKYFWGKAKETDAQVKWENLVLVF